MILIIVNFFVYLLSDSNLFINDTNKGRLIYREEGRDQAQ
jgi:hypothetical protein